jgi:Ca2+-binding RTX toxin-like protein
MASTSVGDTITVGNGNDTIYVGRDNTITVGTGHDSFIFEQTTPGNIGAATITGFDPHKDSWTVLKTWSIGSISDSIGLDGFGAKHAGAARVFRYRGSAEAAERSRRST